MNSFTKDEQETQETPVVVRKKKFSKKVKNIADDTPVEKVDDTVKETVDETKE